MDPPKGVKQDWWIIQEIAKRNGLDWNSSWYVIHQKKFSMK